MIAMHDQRAADELRLERGMLGYCPVCRRPSATSPVGPLEALAAVARHLREDHDPTFAALLRNHLSLPARQTAAPAADPFFPTDASW